MVLEKQPEKQNQPLSPEKIDSLNLLDLQLAAHRKHDKHESWLSWGISKTTTLAGRSDASLKQLEDLKDRALKELHAGNRESFKQIETEIARQVKADRDLLAIKDNVAHYGGGALKTATLFMRGRLALAGTVALYGLGETNTHDSWKTQLADFTLGGAKGGAMKFVLATVGETHLSAATKGIAMGMANTGLEIGLTRKTYQDKLTGHYNIISGASRILDAAFDPRARLVDAGTFTLAHGLFGLANRASLGALERSQLASTILTGGTFGLSSGAAGEYMRQKDSGEGFDLSKIIRSGLTQAAVDSLAAIPGGLQARSITRAAQHQMQTETSDAAKNPLHRKLLVLEEEVPSGKSLRIKETAQAGKSPLIEETGRAGKSPLIEETAQAGKSARIEEAGQAGKSPLIEETEQAGKSARNEEAGNEGKSAAREKEQIGRPFDDADYELELSKKIDWDAPETLEIKPLPDDRLETLAHRIGAHQVVEEGYHFLSSAHDETTVYKNWRDFAERGLEWRQRPMRVYSLSGTDITVAVPEEHAASLEEIRNLQLRAEREKDPELWRQVAEHPKFNTVRPEHIALLLSELPDGGARLTDGKLLVRRINLYYGESSPDDLFLQQTYDKTFKSGGNASREGDINLYSTQKGDSLAKVRRILSHEWAHTMSFAMPEETHLFNLASVLEEKGWSARKYGRKNTLENWAVHMESVLHPDGGYLLDMEAEAPIRLSMLGRAMKNMLDTVPEANRSPHHAQYQQRVRFIEEQVVPAAIDRLMELRDSANARHRKIATILLGQLGGPIELDTLAHQALSRRMSEREAKQTFEAAREIGLRHPRDWSDALVLMSGGEKTIRHLAMQELSQIRMERRLPRRITEHVSVETRREIDLRAAELLLERGTGRFASGKPADQALVRQLSTRGRDLTAQALSAVEKDGFASKQDRETVHERVNRVARLLKRSDPAAGESLAQRLLDLQDYDENHPRTATTLHTIAELQAQQGQRAHALAAYELALDIMEKAYGKKHARTEAVRRDLSNFHLQNQEFARAEQLYEFLLAEQPEAAPSDKADAARKAAMLSQIADRFTDAKDLPFGEQLYWKALELIGDNLDLRAADLTRKLANNLLDQQRLDEAWQLYWDELSIRQQFPNKNKEALETLQNWLETNSETAAAASGEPIPAAYGDIKP
jgi:tetratricopeptide (TPR) repeat protein